RLPVPFDTQIAARLCSQIDPCEFRAVKRYFRNPSSEIQLVVLVQAPYALEEVATVFATRGNGGRIYRPCSGWASSSLAWTTATACRWPSETMSCSWTVSLITKTMTSSI